MESTVESSSRWLVDSMKTFSMEVMAWYAVFVVKSSAPDVGQDIKRGALRQQCSGCGTGHQEGGITSPVQVAIVVQRANPTALLTGDDLDLIT